MSTGIYPRPTLAERFWAKVNKATSGCWEWQATLVNGYGVFWNGTRQIRAHRYAYELLKGKIPEGLTIDHLCRNRKCVNPDHLEVVTMRENVLRGVGITAKNARATHCPKGHPYEISNIYPMPHGGRSCRACRAATSKRLYRLQYAALNPVPSVTQQRARE